MIYSAPEFLVSFPIFLVLYASLRGDRPRLVALAVGSLLFYAYGDLRGIPVLLAAILIAYGAAFAMDRAPTRARAVALVSVGVLVLDLVFFKYASYTATTLGIDGVWSSIAPPLGISFFTFEAIAYVVDKWRGHAATERSLLRFSLFVGLFPHLISGPILRPHEILPQLRSALRIRRAAFVSGLQLFVEGLAKKRLVADPAGSIADRVFAAPLDYNTSALWLGVLAYTLQIYGDFAGYTDMGRGIARMLGIELPLNFNAPYAATSIRDFWRRWHITLSRWLRDYVYIPLGGNRGGRSRTALNLVATMLIGGAWHGAGPTFALWGAYHGVLLAIERLAAPRVSPPLWVTWPITLFLVINGWILFRAHELATYGALMSGLYLPRPGDGLPTRDEAFVIAAFVVVITAMLVSRAKPQLGVGLRRSAIAGGLSYGITAGVSLLTVLSAPTTTRTFIYFRF